MKALMFDGQARVVEDYPMPKRKSGEVLIRVLKAGLCRTDLEIIKGYLEFQGILGHEFVGVVEDGPDKSLIKKRVAGEINITCGNCGYCQKGLASHCANRSVLGIKDKDGCFAEYFT